MNNQDESVDFDNSIYNSNFEKDDDVKFDQNKPNFNESQIKFESYNLNESSLKMVSNEKPNAFEGTKVQKGNQSIGGSNLADYTNAKVNVNTSVNLKKQNINLSETLSKNIIQKEVQNFVVTKEEKIPYILVEMNSPNIGRKVDNPDVSGIKNDELTNLNLNSNRNFNLGKLITLLFKILNQMLKSKLMQMFQIIMFYFPITIQILEHIQKTMQRSTYNQTILTQISTQIIKHILTIKFILILR